MAFKSRKITKSDNEWLDFICEFGCIACHNRFKIFSPPLPHHIDGKTKLGSHKKTIPLCSRHHKDYGYGISLHDGMRFWEEIYGTQEELLKQMKIYYDDSHKN